MKGLKQVFEVERVMIILRRNVTAEKCVSSKLEGCRVKDKIPIKTMLANTKLPSINQLAIEVKLIETWKAVHMEEYPTKMYQGNRVISNNNSNRTLRTIPSRELQDNAKTRIGESSFCIDGAKLWNKAPQEIRESTTLNETKRLVKIYSKIMPI